MHLSCLSSVYGRFLKPLQNLELHGDDKPHPTVLKEILVRLSFVRLNTDGVKTEALYPSQQSPSLETLTSSLIYKHLKQADR